MGKKGQKFIKTRESVTTLGMIGDDMLILWRTKSYLIYLGTKTILPLSTIVANIILAPKNRLKKNTLKVKGTIICYDMSQSI